MSTWFLICNGNYFNLKAAFDSVKTITWPKSKKCTEGDIVYLYVTNPYRAILYKAKVIENTVYKMDSETIKYVSSPLFYDDSQTYMRIEKISEYPDNLLDENQLRELGVTVFQNSYLLSQELADRIDKKAEGTRINPKEETIANPNTIIRTNTNSKLGLGVLGAILGGLLSTAVWIVMFRIGIIAGIVGLLSAVLVFKGYEYLGKGLDTKGVIASVVILVITIYISVFLGMSVSAMSAEGVPLTPSNIKNVFIGFNYWFLSGNDEYGIFSAAIQNLLMSYGFSAIGSFRFVKRVIQQKSVN